MIVAKINKLFLVVTLTWSAFALAQGKFELPDSNCIYNGSACTSYDIYKVSKGEEKVASTLTQKVISKFSSFASDMCIKTGHDSRSTKASFFVSEEACNSGKLLTLSVQLVVGRNINGGYYSCSEAAQNVSGLDYEINQCLFPVTDIQDEAPPAAAAPPADADEAAAPPEPAYPPNPPPDIASICRTNMNEAASQWESRCGQRTTLRNKAIANCIRKNGVHTPYFGSCAEPAQTNGEAQTATSKDVTGHCQKKVNYFISKVFSQDKNELAEDLYDDCLYYDGREIDWDAKITAANEAVKEELAREYENDQAQCEEKRSVAEECCANPESCLGRPDGQENENDTQSAIAQLLQMTASGVATAPGSIKAQCARMGAVGNVMTGVNGYLAYQCGKYVGQCKKTCADPHKELMAKEVCKKNPEICSEIKVAFEDSVEQCKIYDNQSSRLAQQAIASQSATKLSELCQKQVQDETGQSPEDAFANQDCSSPAAAATPYCQALCSKPGAQSNPSCGSFFNNRNNGLTTAPSTGSASSSLGDLFGNLFGDDEGEQSANLEDIAPTQQRSTGGSGAPGGGLGGGGDSGGYDGGDGGGGSYSDEGYNTKIDKGTYSGNGYTTSGRTISSKSDSGFKGYGGGAITDKKGKPLNLKDFLPGKGRGKYSNFRGLATAARDIAPAHGDIFKKITARYAQVCLQDKLYDCSAAKSGMRIKIGN